LSVAAGFDLAAFHHLFRVVHANTSSLRDICYQLRHNVYCEEFGFEPVSSDGLECDEWDDVSIHCLIQNVVNGEYVACARLIVPAFPRPGMPLPFERVCKQCFLEALPDSTPPARSVAEVSRLAILADYRRTAVVREIVGRESPTHDSASQPTVLSGLLLGLLALGQQHGIQTAYMLIERRLARYLRSMMGFRTNIVAGPVEHNGARLLAMLKVEETIAGLNELIQAVFEDIVASLRGDDRLYVPQAGGLAVTTLSRPVRFA
jgi:N-acyl amino acid synthase of PEP-CTERM/exosortase system